MRVRDGYRTGWNRTVEVLRAAVRGVRPHDGQDRSVRVAHEECSHLLLIELVRAAERDVLHDRQDLRIVSGAPDIERTGGGSGKADGEKKSGDEHARNVRPLLRSPFPNFSPSDPFPSEIGLRTPFSRNDAEHRRNRSEQNRVAVV